MKCYHCGQEFTGHVIHCGKDICAGIKVVPRDPLLVEREKTHGSFRKNAETFRKLCEAMGGQLPDPQQEMAVGMILVKLSRLAQTPNVKDHWDDIAGYAKLGAEACDGQ